MVRDVKAARESGDLKDSYNAIVDIGSEKVNITQFGDVFRPNRPNPSDSCSQELMPAFEELTINAGALATEFVEEVLGHVVLQLRGLGYFDKDLRLIFSVGYTVDAEDEGGSNMVLWMEEALGIAKHFYPKNEILLEACGWNDMALTVIEAHLETDAATSIGMWASAWGAYTTMTKTKSSPKQSKAPTCTWHVDLAKYTTKNSKHAVERGHIGEHRQTHPASVG